MWFEYSPDYNLRNIRYRYCDVIAGFFLGVVAKGLFLASIWGSIAPHIGTKMTAYEFKKHTIV